MAKYKYSYSGSDKVLIQSDELGDIIIEAANTYSVFPIAKLGRYENPRAHIIPRSAQVALVTVAATIGLGISGAIGYIMTH